MSVRAKTKKRLVILLVIVAVVVCSGVAFYVVQKHNQKVKVQGYRQSGMTAYEAKDYPLALHDLGKYLRKNENDAEALFCYAMAGKQIPQDRNWHLDNAINLLVRVLSIDPNYPEASQELLALYDLRYKNAEGIDLADKILAANPDNRQALIVKANSLYRLRRLEQAKPLFERIVADDELHILSQLCLFEIEAVGGVEPEVLLDRAKQLHQRHGEHAGVKLVLAYAYRLAGDREQSIELLMGASQVITGDAEYVDLLVRLLDQVGLYSQSLVVLESAVDAGGDQRGELVRRLWESGEREKVIARTELPWPPVLEADIELYGMRGMALVQLERQAEVDALVERLESLEEQRRAKAWVIVLGDVLSGEMTAEQRIIYCRKATDLYGSHAYFNYLAGRTYADMGEYELALKALEYSVEGRPTWRLPRSVRVESLIALGRLDQALDESREMVRRYPQSINAQLDWLTVREMMLDWEDDDEVAQMLEIVSSVQEQLEYEPRSLNLYVRLLAKTGETEKAGEVIAGAMASDREYSEQQILNLADISKQYGLGQTQLCYDHLKQQAGQSPELIYTMAVDLAKDGDVAAGTELLEQSMADYVGDDKSGWRIAWAKWLEMIDDPRAVEQMRMLGEDYPQSMAVQRMVIGSQAAADRVFADATIERMRAISGDSGLSWRIARAQWLLESEDEDGLSQAVAMLEKITRESPGLFEPQMMLGACFERMGKLPNAIEAYTRASELRPDVAGVYIALARMNQRNRDYDAVMMQLSIAAGNENVTAGDLKQIAELYAGQGKYSLAIATLERAYADDAAPADEMLGNLYRQVGAYEKVDAICESLLAAPTLNGLYFVADYYSSRGENEKAQAALLKLKDLELEPGISELIAAEHAVRYVGRDKAAVYYRQAVEAGPGNVDAWTGLMINHLAQSDVEGMLAVLDQGAQALPEDETLQFAKANAGLIRLAGSRVELQPLVVSMLRDSAYREVAVSAIILALEEGGTGSIDGQLLRLRQLADSHQEFAALQNLAVQYLLVNGQYEAAMDVAVRAMDTFPTSSTAAGLAVQAARAAGRWDQVIVAAKRWREVSPGQRMQVDVALAEAMVMTSDAAGAEAHLRGYVDAVKDEPEQASQLLSVYTRALIELGRLDEAEQLFKPLLEMDAKWRGQWMLMAARYVDDSAVAGRWLDEMGAYLPGDSEIEHIEYAQRYSELYLRSRDEQYKVKATAVIDGFIASGNAGVAGWSFQGLLAESFGDYTKAEKGYRKALELDPTLHVIRNNLAMVIVNINGDLDEALQMIEQALAELPNNADYLDTLGQVQAARGEYGLAVQAIEKALMVRPGEVALTARLVEYQSLVKGQ